MESNSAPEVQSINPTALVAVTNYMEAGLAPAFQARAIEWLNSHSETPGSDGVDYSPPFSGTFGPKNAWDLTEWTMADLPAARWIVRQVKTPQRWVIGNLVTSAEHGMWTVELREAAGYGPGKGMSGVFKALSGRCRSCGRRPFWNGGPKDPDKGQLLSVTAGETYQVFLAAIEAEAPEML